MSNLNQNLNLKLLPRKLRNKIIADILTGSQEIVVHLEISFANEIVIDLQGIEPQDNLFGKILQDVGPELLGNFLKGPNSKKGKKVPLKGKDQLIEPSLEVLPEDSQMDSKVTLQPGIDEKTTKQKDEL